MICTTNIDFLKSHTLEYFGLMFSSYDEKLWLVSSAKSIRTLS
jgi:hypothetical protein